MREIKFRGKRKDNGEWFYGCYIVDTKQGKHFIGNYAFGNLYSCEVDPDTVGQYTGLKDKNGVEIYNKDIVLAWHSKYEIMEKCVVEYKNCCFTLGRYWKDGIHNWYSMEQYYSEELEVIGNQFENPELLTP